MSNDIEELHGKMSNASEYIDREIKHMGQRVDLMSDTQFLIQTRLADIERRLARFEGSSSGKNANDKKTQ